VINSALETLIKHGGPWAFMCVFLMVGGGWVIKQLAKVIVANTEAMIRVTESNKQLCSTIKDLKHEIRT
jgi:hypothetical protein